MNMTIKKPNLTHSLCFMFSGKAGTGKSWASDYAQKFCDEAGLKTFKAPLARGVKETATFMGWDGKKDEKGRVLLQEIGKAGRSYDQSLWSRSAFNHIEEQVGFPFDVVFIDDWRFKDEYDYVMKNQPLYKVVSVRMVAPIRESLIGKPSYYDESETALDGIVIPDMSYVSNDPECLSTGVGIEAIIGRAFIRYSLV